MKKIFALTFAAAMACATSAFAECATGDHGAISIQDIDGVCTAVIYGDATASDAYNTLDKFSATVDSVYYYKGKTTKNAAQSIVLPFSVKPGCNKEGLSFHTIQKIYKNNNQKWVVYAPDTVDVEKNGLSANTPYLIKVESGDMFFKLGGEGCSFEINTDASVTELPYDGESGLTGSWLFKGTYETIQWNAGDSELGYVYGLSSKNVSYANGAKDSIKVGQFVKAAAGASITPLRAYLRYVPKKAVGAKMRSLASTEEGSVDGEQDDVIDVVLGRSAEVPAATFPVGECFTEGDGIIALKNVDGKRTFCIDGTSDARLQNVLEMNVPNGTKVNNIEYNRTFPVGEDWGKVASTIVFPFDIRYGCVEGAQFYQIVNIKTYTDNSGSNVWQISASEIRNGTKANTPYFVYAQKEKMTFLSEQWGSSCDYVYSISETIKDTSFSATYMENGTPQGFPGTWTFKGTYERLTFDNSNKSGVYGFAAKQTETAYPGMFVKAGVGASVPPMRGYLKYDINGVVGAKAASGVIASIPEEPLPDSIFVEFLDADGNPMAIGTMNTLTGEIKMDENAWFDMKGRKMNKKPTVKGTYYNKGQKVIIK